MRRKAIGDDGPATATRVRTGRPKNGDDDYVKRPSPSGGGLFALSAFGKSFRYHGVMSQHERRSGPCTGCYTEVTTACGFRGTDEWIIAALSVIMGSSIEEAESVLSVYRRDRAKDRPTTGSLLEALVVPQPDQPVNWDTILIGCCASCAARGRFEVNDEPRVPVYVEPPLEGVWN